MIVLCTHFMDEADFLGVRIIVMSKGELQVAGSSLFLKSKYGIGYHMSVAKEEGAVDDDILNVIKTHAPEASVEETSKTMVVVNLPRERTVVFGDILEELEARVRSLTRRSFVQHDAVLRCGELSFDTVKRTAQAKGENVALTRKENGILEYLLLNQGRPVSQEELMEHVWDGSVDSFSNSIRVHISSLRKKLKAALGYDPILNRFGEGYLMGGQEA